MTDAEKIKLLTEALQNMMAAFDSPISRMRLKSGFAEECRQSGRDALEKTGSFVPGRIGLDHPDYDGLNIPWDSE